MNTHAPEASAPSVQNCSVAEATRQIAGKCQEGPESAAIDPAAITVPLRGNGPTARSAATTVEDAETRVTDRNSAGVLDLSQFPHPPRSGGHSVPTTIENVEHLLDQSGITVGFDVIKKVVVARREAKPCTTIEIVSLATRYGLNGSWLLSFIQDIAARNPINPVKDWIDSKPWDGTDRMPEFLATVDTVDGYPEGLKDTLIRRWMLSATAAALLADRRFSSRGVLTLQGPQGIGKTSWIASVVPPGKLRDDVIKRDHHMDGGNKDSILGAISHWLVEIGELDSSFRKDVARLKGFLTNDCDKVRPPYGRQELEYDRRTVFVATVNDEAFLVDHTGNSRFWTIAVKSLDYNHTINMQQVFAQLAQGFREGEQWWLTQAEEEALAAYNLRHRAVSAVAERVKEFVDLEAIGKGTGTYMTAVEVLAEAGIKHPNNAQCRECGAVLRELIGAPRRVQGRDRWRVPKLPTFEFKRLAQVDPDEEY